MLAHADQAREMDAVGGPNVGDQSTSRDCDGAGTGADGNRGHARGETDALGGPTVCDRAGTGAGGNRGGARGEDTAASARTTGGPGSGETNVVGDQSIGSSHARIEGSASDGGGAGTGTGGDGAGACGEGAAAGMRATGDPGIRSSGRLTEGDP
jgi:hypothetical protein